MVWRDSQEDYNARMNSRRRFLAQSAAISVAAAASWLTHRQLNRPPPLAIHRIGLPLGHLLRDGAFVDAPLPRAQDCDVLILGSGAAALSALWYLTRQGQRNVILAEGLERNGNNAAFVHGELRAPGGAHYLALPSRESVALRAMLADLGILESGADSDAPRFRETDLVFAPAERLRYQGRWQEALLPQEDDDSRRFFALIQRLKRARGSDGRKVFAIPIALSSQDNAWRALDRLTFAEWLAREGYRSPTLLWYLDYCCRDDYGAGAAQVSAFAGLHYFAARGHDSEAVLTWPDGLAHLSQLLRERSGLQALAALPDAATLHFAQPVAINASAVRIRESEAHVEVLLRDNDSGARSLLHARQVICAMPLMVAARVVENAAAYGLLAGRGDYAPWLVSNFVLHRFPAEGASEALAWDNVIHGSGGLGYVAASNQLIRVAKPARTVFTTYTALNQGDPTAVRAWLLDAPDAELLAFAAQDLVAAYGRHFWRAVEAVDINIRAHAMRIPRPGYLDDAQLAAVRAHRSRLLFAHSDLGGYSVFEEAAFWGVEAARQVFIHTAERS